MDLTRKELRKLADELGDLASDGWYVAQRELVRRYGLSTAQLQQVIDEYEGRP